jgi:hypothetical protein
LERIEQVLENVSQDKFMGEDTILVNLPHSGFDFPFLIYFLRIEGVLVRDLRASIQQFSV